MHAKTAPQSSDQAPPSDDPIDAAIAVVTESDKGAERVLIRYQSEGVMVHPWHTHGFRQHVVARDGAQLGSASFYCDTLGVNPGERFDAIVEAERVGTWAFQYHILPHVEGLDGMSGMVTALVVTE